MEHPVATGFVVAGVLLVVVGFLVRLGAFAWFGHLPGDLRIERESVTVFVPITSMIVVSVVLSLIVSVARRLS